MQREKPSGPRQRLISPKTRRTSWDDDDEVGATGGIDISKQLDEIFDDTIGPVRRKKEQAVLQNAAKVPVVESDEVKFDIEKPVTVYVKVRFVRLGEIDTVNEKFTASVLVQARWRDRSFDGIYMNRRCELVEPLDQYWTPSLYIDNALNDSNDTPDYSVQFDSEGLATVTEKKLFSGMFYERIELWDYPFDTQELSVKLTTDHRKEDVFLENDPFNKSTVSVDNFYDHQTWEIFPKVRSWKEDAPIGRQMSRIKPSIYFTCVAQRRSNFFYYNVILLMILVCGQMFTAFTIKVEKVESRLAVSFILILSTVTFKFSVAKSIPKISYMTSLDKYVLITMVSAILVSVWHGVALALPDDIDNTADNVFLGGFGIFYVLFNVSYLAWSFLKKRQCRLEYEELTADQT